MYRSAAAWARRPVTGGGGTWLGLDLGTSSVKALLVDEQGAVAGRGRAHYDTAHGEGGRAEQDPAAYLTALAEAVAQCGSLETLQGIGLAGQTPSCVFVDADGRALRPAMTWQDVRAQAEARELAGRFDAEEQIGVALPWDASYPPAKLLWLCRHEPRLLTRTRWVLQPKDLAGLHLTGVAGSDPWSSKGLVDVRTREPAFELLAAVGWRPEVVPPVDDAWATLGEVRPAAAETYGLPAGTPVTVGWSDALAGMLAAGAFDGPVPFVLTGTSDIVGRSHDGGDLAAPGLFSIPASCAPLPVVYGPTQSSGASLAWLAAICGTTPDVLVELAGAARDEGLPTFVPYLSGERAPVWNADARGAFLGLDAHHDRGQLARAVLRGVSMTARHVLDVAEGVVGTAGDGVVLGGRSASLPAWIDARLAALGRPLQVLGEPDASCLGAAMLAAMAGGRSPRDVAALRGDVTVVAPSAEQVAGSRARFERYLQAVDATLAWSP